MEKGIYVSTIVIFSLVLLGVIVSFLAGLLLVPITPTPRKIREEISQIMGLEKDEMILDLGSGNGIFLIEAAKRYRIKGIGYEISPMGIFISKFLKIFKLGFNKQIVIVPTNFLNNTPLPFADKIYCYLNPKAMETLYKKMKEEDLHEEVEIYSYKYPFPEVKPIEEKKLSDENLLYIYKGDSFNT